MESEPTRDPGLTEAMEVCRPGHDDLSDPGLAFLADRLASDPELDRVFRRLQRLDAALADTFCDVPVPPGLADRILARLAVDKSHSPSVAMVSEVPGETAPVAVPVRRISARWLLAGAGSIAVAIAMLVFVTIGIGKPGPIDGSNAAEVAIEFFVTEAAGPGQPADEVAPPESHPFAADVRQFPGIRWREVPDFLGHTAVAYDIPGPAGEGATLYVVRGRATNVPDRPPRQPLVTQGATASVWQSDECLYVLVVQGGARAYESLLVTPRAPLT